MKKEIVVTVTGRVQGVMFRDFAQRNARGLRLVGTVQNMKDGSVRIVAVGEESDLQTFLKKLERRPLLSRIVSRIENIEAVWSEPVHTFTKFDILY
ncbi:MAG: acylphosphatase [Candidatus Pacebacteria bacterium]|nr:acylphosphatase [Candidatus Paceibacterota bacterium]MDD5356883.1 acylphosphatase [Candidatus Paceibacterota bacterium]